MMSSDWRIATAAPDRDPVTAYLGLGSNVGDRGTNLAAALRRIAVQVEVLDLSSVWESEPVGWTSQASFWNLVVRARTQDPPASLLMAMKQIEADIGRTPTFVNGPREIDIDLLLYDDIVLHTGSLDVPHPRMLTRAFVLRPLIELEPDIQVTGTGRTARDHLEHGGPFERAFRLFPAGTLVEGIA